MTVGKRTRASSPKILFVQKKALASFLCLFLLAAQIFAQGKKNAASLFEEGMNFQDERNWWAASERYQEALKINPSYADAWYRLAQCVYELDSPETALEYLQNAKKYAPGRSDLLNLEGMALISLGRLDEAQKIFEGIQKKYPNDIDSRFGLAELNLFRGRVSGAESLYADALKINPGSVKALLSLALISAELGKYSLAERFINQATQSHADNPQVYYVAAWLNFKKGEISAAEKRALSAIQVAPDYFEAYELLALIYFKQGRYDEVIDLTDWALSRDRNRGATWHLKGLAQCKLKAYEKAINTWTLGLEAVPEDEIMRASFELLVRDKIDLEDPRRASWAKYHVQKAADYSKKYAGAQMRYEYQAALRLEPTNYSARSAFSRLLRGQGFSENYLAQIKFIQENEILQAGIERKKNLGKALSADEEKEALVRLSDTVEGYESLLQNTLASKWNVNPFYLDKTRWTVGLYYLPTNAPLMHPELERVVSEHLSVLFKGILGTNVLAFPKAANSFANAYSDSRKNGYDYFIIISADESERDIEINAQMNSARTGTLTQNFSVFKTGNNRYVQALLSLRQGILDILPVRAKILERSGNDVLVDIGRTEGLVKGAKFAVVRKGALKTADSGRGLRFDDEDLLGTVTLVDVAEDISEGLLGGTGFYDRVNARDELILIEMPKDGEDASEAAKDTAPAAGKDGNPVDGKSVEAAADDPLRGSNAKAAKMPELINMIRRIQ